MRIAKINFWKNPNIGLFSFSTDKFCMTNTFLHKNDTEVAKRVLKVKVIKTQLLGTSLIGIFSTGNSSGVIVSSRIYEEEIKRLEKQLNVLVLDTKYTALGNLILCNDKVCVISEKLKLSSKKIGDFLGVEVKIGTITGMDLVGSLAVCNNIGCLAHRNIKQKEKELLEKVLKVKIGTGTVNFGNPWIKSGVIANSFGFLAGDQTSGPEMGMIAEALGFV